MQRLRGGLVLKAHRLLYHSILGLRAIKKADGGHQGLAGVMESESVAAPSLKS